MKQRAPAASCNWIIDMFITYSSPCLLQRKLFVIVVAIWCIAEIYSLLPSSYPNSFQVLFSILCVLSSNAIENLFITYKIINFWYYFVMYLKFCKIYCGIRYVNNIKC